MYLQLSILLVLLARTLARCPHESVIEPCTCSDGLDGDRPSHVVCQDFDNYDDLQRVFDHSLDYPFDGLSFLNCVIPHLNLTWIATKKVKMLVMGQLIMYDLMHGGTASTLPTVDELVIGGSKIMRRLRWDNFRPFTGLTNLFIFYTEVRKLGKDFERYVSPYLFRLTLTHARVKSLTDGSLKGKTHLSHITFQGNQIRILKNSFFKDQRTSLLSINFSENPIEFIPDDLFDGMDYLTSVALFGTNLKTLSKFLHFGKYIESLDVSGNPFVCDCQMSWIPDRIRTRELTILGQCNSPPNLKSKFFENLTYKDFRACDSE